MTNKAGDKFIFLMSCMMVSLILLSAKESFALPVFARKYHTACSTCHIAFPARNGFGEAFRNNGYRFPNDTDEEMVKEEPIKLGQEAYKDVFPNAIWPSDLPNMPSLGFLAKSGATLQKNPMNGKYRDVKYNAEVDMFFAGTITKQLSYIGDLAFDGGTNGGDAVATTLGRLQLVWTFRPGLSMAWGDVGFPEQFDLISARAGTDLDGYAASLPNPNRGVELRIAGNTGACGGYSLLAGIGRNSEVGATDPNGNDLEVHGNITDTRFVRATFKVGGNGLLSGVGGSYGIQSIGMDNSITFGVNYVNSGQGANTGSEDRIAGLTKNAYSGDVRINYGPVRAVAQYAHFNEVLNSIELTDSYGNDIPRGAFNYGKRNALSFEADYWLYPWLFGLVRYEHLHDDLNGRINKIIPGIGALVRPNFKVGVEYVSVTKDAVADEFDANHETGNSINLYTQVGF
ncbi:MAG: hypothetical protein NT163_00325 [Chlorobiales bacterium]|nr:hypothetical protein [Chlorobiales bacterium]